MRNKFKMCAFIGIALCLLSCSQEDNFEGIENTPIGRFDNSPFVWDEEYSSRPFHQLFIGDISADKLYNINPSIIYVGAVFPQSSFGRSFDREIVDARNPIDIIFDFRDPYIDEVKKETGSIGYKLAIKNALRSDEYQSHLKTHKPTVDYSMTSYSSYRDIQKSISGSTKFGSIFSAKVQANASSHKINIKGRLIARMTATNFNVYMDTPRSFFKDTELNNDPNNVYIRSLTYGKVVYMAIESEYDYSEVKKAFQTSFSTGFLSSSIKGSTEITKIFNSSIVTIFVIDDNSEGHSFYDLSDIGKINNLLFSSDFDGLSYGFPIYCEGRYVRDNRNFNLSTNRYISPNGNSIITTERN